MNAGVQTLSPACEGCGGLRYTPESEYCLLYVRTVFSVERVALVLD